MKGTSKEINHCTSHVVKSIESKHIENIALYRMLENTYSTKYTIIFMAKNPYIGIDIAKIMKAKIRKLVVFISLDLGISAVL